MGSAQAGAVFALAAEEEQEKEDDDESPTQYTYDRHLAFRSSHITMPGSPGRRHRRRRRRRLRRRRRCCRCMQQVHATYMSGFYVARVNELSLSLSLSFSFSFSLFFASAESHELQESKNGAEDDLCEFRVIFFLLPGFFFFFNAQALVVSSNSCTVAPVKLCAPTSVSPKAVGGQGNGRRGKGRCTRPPMEIVCTVA